MKEYESLMVPKVYAWRFVPYGWEKVLMKKRFNIDLTTSFILYLELLITLYFLCRNGSPSFDGGMNLQIPVNLIEKGVYAGNYPSLTLFDEKVQTGIPVLLPIALLIKIFGKSFPVILTINAIYIFFFIVAVNLILIEIKMNRKWFNLLFPILVFTPYFWNYGMGIYGEISALSLYVFSVFLVIKGENRNTSERVLFFTSGIFMGLAYLTKTVILIGVPGFVIVFLYKYYKHKCSTINIFLWILGFICPVLAFEAFKFIQIGGFVNYIEWWSFQLDAILKQAGVKSGYKDTENLIEKNLTHIQLFVNFFGVRSYLVFISAILGGYCNIKNWKNKDIGYEQIIFFTGLFYLIWWVAITPTQKAWARRIINGMLLLEISLLINLIKIFDKKSKKINFLNVFQKARFVWYIFFLIATLFLGYDTIKDITPAAKQAVIETGNKIKEIDNNYDNAVFCGFDWYQAPVVSYCSEKEFVDFYRLKRNEDFDFKNCNYFLVVDNVANGSVPRGIENILDTIEYENIYIDETFGYQIYKIDNILRHRIFTENDQRNANQNYFIKSDDYKPIAGFYNYETSGIRWVSKNSAILLKYEGEEYLQFKIYVGSFDQRQEDAATFILSINGEKVFSGTCFEDGVYGGVIALNDYNFKKGSIKEIEMSFDSIVNSKNDSRELAFCIEEIGFCN